MTGPMTAPMTARTTARTDDSADNITAAIVDARVVVVPATLAKGLEFDSVVVVEPAAIVAADPLEWQGLRRLYVCLTRAVTALAVVHAEPLPEPLAARPLHDRPVRSISPRQRP